ncbi:MAG: ATP-binding protein [Aminivibrio sp.]|jgi:hypothetical protein
MLDDLSLHILDVAENGVNAGAGKVSIEIDHRGDLLKLVVGDNGRGMDEETVKAVTNPFYTTRTERRVGLGLPFLKQLAELCEGDFSVVSAPGKGTVITASFMMSSVDAPPLGDIPSTLFTLFLGYPDVTWDYIHRRNDNEFILNSDELKEALGGGNPFADPSLSMAIKEFMETNLAALYE